MPKIKKLFLLFLLCLTITGCEKAEGQNTSETAANAPVSEENSEQSASSSFEFDMTFPEEAKKESAWETEGILTAISDYDTILQEALTDRLIPVNKENVDYWITNQMDEILMHEPLMDKTAEADDYVNVDIKICEKNTGKFLHYFYYTSAYAGNDSAYATIPELSKSLVGKKAGDTYQVEITDGGVAEILYVTVNFVEGTEYKKAEEGTLSYQMISQKQCNTREEMEVYALNQIHIQLNQVAKEEALDVIVEESVFDEEKMNPFIEEKIKEGMKAHRQEAADEGFESFDEYKEYYQITDESLQISLKESAERYIKESCVLYQIAKEQNLLTDDFFSQYIVNVLSDYGFLSTNDYLEEFDAESLRTDCIKQIVLNEYFPNVDMQFTNNENETEENIPTDIPDELSPDSTTP